MRYTFAPPQPDDSAASPVHFRTAAYNLLQKFTFL